VANTTWSREKDGQGIKESIPIGIDDVGNTVGLEGFYLDDNELVFTNEKPYVVYRAFYDFIR